MSQIHNFHPRNRWLAVAQALGCACGMANLKATSIAWIRCQIIKDLPVESLELAGQLIAWDVHHASTWKINQLSNHWWLIFTCFIAKWIQMVLEKVVQHDMFPLSLLLREASALPYKLRQSRCSLCLCRNSMRWQVHLLSRKLARRGGGHQLAQACHLEVCWDVGKQWVSWEDWYNNI